MLFILKKTIRCVIVFFLFYNKYKGDDFVSIQYAMCVPHPPLIIPKIGKGEEKTISNTIQSYKSIMKYVSTLPIETVIVIKSSCNRL